MAINERPLFFTSIGKAEPETWPTNLYELRGKLPQSKQSIQSEIVGTFVARIVDKTKSIAKVRKAYAY